MTEYMASSPLVGRRPRISRMRAYSSSFRPRAAYGCSRSGVAAAFSTESIIPSILSARPLGGLRYPPGMAEPKTRPTDVPVDEFLATVDEPRRSQAEAVRELMTRATGVEPVMWGPSIVGYGTMQYTNTSGTYDWPVVGFSPRK